MSTIVVLKRLFLITILFFPLTPVLGLTEGFYFGLNGGLSASSYNSDNLNVDINAPIPSCPSCSSVALSTPLNTISPFFSSIPNSGALSVDDNGPGGRLYLGYKFYKILSIEGGYTRYADTLINNIFQVDSSPSTTATVLPPLIGTNARVEQQSLDLSAKLFIPILDLFELYGLVGMSYIDSFIPDNVQFDVIPQGDVLASPSYLMKVNNKHHFNYELMYGFGMAYSFDDRFMIGLTYQQIRPNSSHNIQKTSLVGLDFLFSFG